ncbi:hypothetical protein ANN_12833 [Periplaneta americana]|uniref:Uncharacterized protein n=1 Tax=Periplaneta americana TaxID=6978 RepID=A0ABQ8THN7_PERAM|nr:hypothetical protein ANN_12833 [Periplaneta americana]
MPEGEPTILRNKKPGLHMYAAPPPLIRTSGTIQRGTWLRERHCDDTPFACKTQIQMERSLTPVSERVGVGEDRKQEKCTGTIAGLNVLVQSELAVRFCLKKRNLRKWFSVDFVPSMARILLPGQQFILGTVLLLRLAVLLPMANLPDVHVSMMLWSNKRSALSETKEYDPFFFRGKKNYRGFVYLDILQNFLIPHIDEDDQEGEIHFSRMVHLHTTSKTSVIFSTSGFLFGGSVVEDRHDGHIGPPT